MLCGMSGSPPLRPKNSHAAAATLPHPGGVAWLYGALSSPPTPLGSTADAGSSLFSTRRGELLGSASAEVVVYTSALRDWNSPMHLGYRRLRA